MSKGEDALV